MPCDISASSRSSNHASPTLSVSPAPPPHTPPHSTVIHGTDGTAFSLPGDDHDTSVTLPCLLASDTTLQKDASFSSPKGESGVELCHQTLAVAERCTRQLRKMERGVKMSLERHLMSSEPQLIASRPVRQTQRRRKKLFE